MMYSTVDYEGQFAIRNNADGSLLRSKESSSVIKFPESHRADKVRDFFQDQYNQIVDASRMWLQKIDGQTKRIYID